MEKMNINIVKKSQNNLDYEFVESSSSQVITELKKVIPLSFRGRRILNVGTDTNNIAPVIGKHIGANTLSAYDIRNNLAQVRPDGVFDLTMFIDVLDQTSEPDDLLKRASTMSKFVLVRSAFGKSPTLQNQIDEGGYEIVQDENFRLPSQALSLRRGLARLAENLSWRLARNFYPDMWGGTYVAFLKSQNVQVIDPDSAQTIQEIVMDEFSKENLTSIGLFGSTTRDVDKRHSDYDFTIILKELPDDVYEREQASPRLKRRLRDRGVDELCAFNLYTEDEFR